MHKTHTPTLLEKFFEPSNLLCIFPILQPL